MDKSKQAVPNPENINKQLKIQIAAREREIAELKNALDLYSFTPALFINDKLCLQKKCLSIINEINYLF